MSRETFLARVRAAAESGRQYRVHLRPFPADAGYLGAGDDLVDRFATEASAVLGNVHIVDDLSAARIKLAELLRSSAARTALTWEHPLLDRLGLADLLATSGVERLSHATLVPLEPAEQRRRMLAADIGITSVTWAVAETGSAVLASAPGSERLASLLPPFYVTIIERQQLLPDLFDLFNKYDAANGGTLPSNLVFITGPSKTGDIELRLTVGVHGPGKWHVILLRENA